MVRLFDTFQGMVTAVKLYFHCLCDLELCREHSFYAVGKLCNRWEIAFFFFKSHDTLKIQKLILGIKHPDEL